MAVPLNNQERLSFEEIKNLLRELDLSAKLTYILRGGFPIPCCGGYLSVDDGGLIHFVEKEEEE